jgi:hypothetical protein
VIKILRPLALAAFALAVLAVPAQAKLTHFTSPSGNIDCLGSTDAPVFVQCLVQNASWSRLPPRPANCDLDWSATEVQLSNRRVSVGACRGDVGPLCTPPGSGFSCGKLRYGNSVGIGPIKCTSLVSGMVCRYKTAPRKGFKVSRQGYTILR